MTNCANCSTFVWELISWIAMYICSAHRELQTNLKCSQNSLSLQLHVVVDTFKRRYDLDHLRPRFVYVVFVWLICLSEVSQNRLAPLISISE